MDRMEFRNRWVLVTGASSGLGRAMVIRLARHYGASVIAVARRGDRLEQLRREVADTKCGFEPIVADLGSLEQVDRVIGQATADRRLYAAVLNAGVTHFGRHEELSWEGFRSMLDLNVLSVVRMTSALLPHLQQKQEGGGILIVASMSGITPTPYQSAYSGTKAFLVNYGCSLWYEARQRGVSITTVAPGGVVTEMTAGEAFQPLRRWLMPVEPAAWAALEAFRLRKHLVVPGWTNKLGTLLLRLLPRPFVATRLGNEYRAALEIRRSG